jgi:hypothetical protein
MALDGTVSCLGRLMFTWFRNRQKKIETAAAAANPVTLPNAAASWSAKMWYRFLVYRENDCLVSFDVDVMAEGPDVVGVPSAEAWAQSAPAFVRNRRDEVLARLKGIKWNRDLIWEEGDESRCGKHDACTQAIPGSIESTEGGKYLEHLGLFNRGSPMSFAEARKVWIQVEEKFAACAKGTVTLFVSQAKPNSMFKKVSLPALQKNPNVTLDFR